MIEFPTRADGNIKKQTANFPGSRQLAPAAAATDPRGDMMKRLGLSILLGVSLAGCGGGESEATVDIRPDEAPAKASNAPASAAEVAREARGKLKCPPKLASPARAAAAPVDDIVGVRPGLGYEDAANLVMCSNDLMTVVAETRARFNIPTYGQTVRQGFHGRLAQERVQKTNKDYMREMQDAAMARGTNRLVQDVAPGEAKWYVGTMGMPGAERVTDVAREEWFAEGKQPPMTVVEKALTDKYGLPTERIDPQRLGYTLLRWAFYPDGRQITETSRVFQACYVNAYVNEDIGFMPDCGVVVAAHIHPLRENPAIAQSMVVVAVNQAEGYASITATEQALQQQEIARRARQAEDAAKNADAPTL